MHQAKHPFSGDIYELDDQGRVVVAHGDLTGVFDGRGRPLEGALKIADPQLCNWLWSWWEMRRAHGGLNARDRGAAFSDPAILAVLESQRTSAA